MYIDQTTCHNDARSLIFSRFGYCNGILSSLPSTYITRLQRLQNCLVFEVYRKQITQTTFEITTLAFNTAKDQFQLLLFVYVPNRQLRSSNDYIRLVYPITLILATSYIATS